MTVEAAKSDLDSDLLVRLDGAQTVDEAFQILGRSPASESLDSSLFSDPDAMTLKAPSELAEEQFRKQLDLMKAAELPQRLAMAQRRSSNPQRAVGRRRIFGRALYTLTAITLGYPRSGSRT